VLRRRAGEDPGRGTLRVDVAAARALLAHDWPLNVRELEHALTTACLLAHAAGGSAIHLEHLPPAMRDADDEAPASDEDAPARPLSADEQRHRDEVVALLREHKGNLSAIARATGKGRTQVQRWMKRYALDAERFR
jgi:DNA-binding NtrC family response regulator